MRILIVKLSSLGDILHVLPTAHALREQTGATLDWVVHPEFAPLVRTFADVDEVLTFPRHHIARDFRASVRALRAREYDMAIDLHGLFKSGLVTRLARAKRRIGPSYSREFSWLFYGERAGRMNRARHAADQAMDVLDHLHLKRPAPDAAASSVFRPVEASLPPGSPHVAFAPVSRWKTKDWPAEHYARLARLLWADHQDISILVFGGKADADVGDAIAAAAPEGAVHNLCGKTTIAESIALLGKCDLLVANDTGPVHMAAAVGTHCLVLFGPTRPDWTGPYGPGHRILSAHLPCQPCLKRTCRRGDIACMMALSPAEVLQAAEEMLPPSPTPPPAPEPGRDAESPASSHA